MRTYMRWLSPELYEQAKKLGAKRDDARRRLYFEGEAPAALRFRADAELTKKANDADRLMERARAAVKAPA